MFRFVTKMSSFWLCSDLVSLTKVCDILSDRVLSTSSWGQSRVMAIVYIVWGPPCLVILHRVQGFSLNNLLEGALSAHRGECHSIFIQMFLVGLPLPLSPLHPYRLIPSPCLDFSTLSISPHLHTHVQPCSTLPPPLRALCISPFNGLFLAFANIVS